MKNNHRMTIMVVLALTFALIPSPLIGALWSEVGDAGSSTGTAQPVTGSFEFTGIGGNLTSGDLDIYQIRITNPVNFAFIVTFTGGHSDTILALFNSSGLGVVYNDNITTADARSRLDYTSTFVNTPGDYYLAIMGGGQTFMSVGGNIWNKDTLLDTQKTPDGPGAGGPLAGYAVFGDPTAIGSYTITVAGGVTPVPEPAFYGVAFALMGLVVAGIRSRSSSKSIFS